MSVTVELQVVNRGENTYLEAAWALKERIRRREGVLKQRRGFFARAYVRAKVHALVDDGTVIGFAATRPDGYLLFLAVDPDRRHEGHGRRLIAEVADEHDVVTCHVRQTNRRAIEFYERLGFQRQQAVARYYEDGGDAYLMRLGEAPSLRDRIREYIP